MALIRAMNSAVSGIRAQQVRIDTIGDNLANSTTNGFKSGRVTFQTMLSQTMKFGSAPQGFLGGIDPVQIGLGVQVAETSRDFSQGELEVTGRTSDLAIDGDGFFVLKDTNGALVFSRDGSFTINPSNLLHNPSNGMIVQGINADLTTFTIASGGPLENIKIPLGELQLAVQTTSAKFGGNLNGGGQQALQGSILETAQFVDMNTLAPATSATLLTDLGRNPENPGPAFDLGLNLGDSLFVAVKKGDRTLPTARFVIGTGLVPGADGFGTTLGDFVAFLQRMIGINTGGTDKVVSAIFDDDNNPNTLGLTGISTGFTPSGSSFIGTTYTASTAAQAAADAAAINAAVAAGTSPLIRWNTGQGAGQIATIASASSLGTTVTITFTAALPATTPLPAVGDAFSVHFPPGVIVTPAGYPTGTAQGRVRIHGNVGFANRINQLDITTSTGIQVTPIFERQQAEGESIIANATFYDSIGNPHLVEMTFALETKNGTDPSTNGSGNTWRWYAESQDNQQLAGTSIVGKNRVVGTGTITFQNDGKFLVQNPLAAIALNLQNNGVSSPMTVTPDFRKMTGFADTVSQVFLTEQDGSAVGVLQDFSVAEDGKIIGIFSNGLTRNLAQIQLARFNNNNGLTQLGANNFQVDANSGIPIIGIPGKIGLGQVQSGVLEASNVDLSREFTNLIIAQRAFQANARTISVSNSLLDELVRLI